MTTTEIIIHRKTRGYGYIPDLPDHRDKHYKKISFFERLDLPTKADVLNIDIKYPVQNQGQLGSCTNHGIGAAIANANIKQDIDNNRFDTSKVFFPSRLFIYYNERYMEGTIGYDSGAMVRDGIKSVNTLGVCREGLWQYDISRFTEKPPPRAYDEALFHHSLKYERLDNTDISQLKNVIANDKLPFVFGFTVYEGFESEQVSKTGIMSIPSANERILGGHCVVAVGYDDSTKMFKCRNSWGSDWGDHGYFYMPYDYITNPNLADDFWVINLVSESDQ